MMKNKIISIVVLLIFLLIGFIYLNKVFSTSHYYVNTSEDFKALAKKSNIDLIFYGSSHAYTAFNPLIFNKEVSIISYNLGSDALRITVTDLVLQESLKYTKPKLVILEIYQHSLVFPDDESGKGFQLRALDFVSNLSFLKFKKVMDIYQPKEYLGVYFPLIRNHDKWHEFDYFNLSRRFDFDMSENFYFNGFLGSNLILDGEEREKYKDFRSKHPYIDTKRSEFNELAKEDLRNFIAIAKKAGSEVLIVTSPDPRIKYWNNYFFEELKNFCASLEVPYLNLNDYYNEIDLKITDFKDFSHLNTVGSIKTSKFLADYLKENYNFKDRSADPIFKEQTKDYDTLKANFKPFAPVLYTQKVNKTLFNELVISDIALLKEQKDKLSLTINLKDKSQKPLLLDNYRLAIHVYPSKKDFQALNETSKSRNLDYEVHGYVFEKDINEINVTFDSNIRNIEKLEFFLFDKGGYKGVIGEKVILDSIYFSNK